MKQVPFGPVRFDVMQLKRKDRKTLNTIEELQEELDMTLTEVSGNPITISGSSNTNAENLNATITLSQAGTGVPSPDNVRAISGVSTLKVYGAGKNLCPMPTFSSAIGYAEQPTNKTDIINLINSLPAGNYIVSAKFQLASRNSTSDNSVCGFYFSGVSSQQTIESWGTSSVGATKTVTNRFTKTDSMTCTAAYFYGCGNNADGATGTATLTEFQIELGSSATTYEPYQGTAITLNLGSNVYGGSVDATAGVLTENRKMYEFEGGSDESWSVDGPNSSDLYEFSIAHSGDISTTNAICNMLELQSTAFSDTTTEGFHIDSTNIYLRLASSKASTVAELKTWLASNNIQVCGVLSTPTTTQLTAQQLRLLTGNNTIWSNGDTLSFSYQPNNLIGELKAWVLDQLS